MDRKYVKMALKESKKGVYTVRANLGKLEEIGREDCKCSKAGKQDEEGAKKPQSYCSSKPIRFDELPRKRDGATVF